MQIPICMEARINIFVLNLNMVPKPLYLYRTLQKSIFLQRINHKNSNIINLA